MSEESQVVEFNGVKVMFVIGVIVVIFTIAIYPMLNNDRREMRKRIVCASNQKQIGLAMIMYAGDKGGEFPNNGTDKDSMTLLTSNSYIVYGDVFMCPSTKNQAIENGIGRDHETDYDYIGDNFQIKDNDPTPMKTVIMRDKEGNHEDFRNQLFVDGHVEGVGADW